VELSSSKGLFCGHDNSSSADFIQLLPANDCAIFDYTSPNGFSPAADLADFSSARTVRVDTHFDFLDRLVVKASVVVEFLGSRGSG
jgi:uncharacterized protein (DUF1800 family)